MEFLSKAGLSHLVDKIKGSFVTRKEFEQKTEKKVEETICVRKAIKLNSVFHHVSYYHASLIGIPINLTFTNGNGAGKKKVYSGGYYRFKDTRGNFPVDSLVNQKGSTTYPCTKLSNNIFQVTEIPESKGSWNNWQIIFDTAVVGEDIKYHPNIIKVVNVSIVKEDGKEIVDVTLNIESAKELIYNGKTSSPYFGLYNGVVRPMMGKEEKLPFEGIDYLHNTYESVTSKFDKKTPTSMLNKNRVELYIKRKYTKKNPKNKKPKNIYRYKLSSRSRTMNLKNVNGGSFVGVCGGSNCAKGGHALVKCYHRGICVSTRRLFINIGEKKTFKFKD